MLTLIDNFLNKITMYRLVLYVLLGMVLGGVVLSFFNALPFNALYFILSLVFITIICFLANLIFARVFHAETNAESFYITALILTLILNPIKDLTDVSYWGFLFWVSVWSMASKYIFAIGKKHIFNPVAFAVTLSALTLNHSASWWIGTLYMLPFVVVGGILITRKIRRFDLVLTFIVISLITIIAQRFSLASDWEGVLNTGMKAVFYSPLLFFATIMLTEPLTTPPAKIPRMTYGAISGFLFSPFVHIGSIYSTPELALLLGNIFSYFASPKQKLILKLKEKIKIADSVYDFIFVNEKKFNFKPGQYLEWTSSPKGADTRGNRRYFTIASSPTEEDIRLGVKFYDGGSSFKTKLLAMKKGDTVVASQLSGEFIMPHDPKIKLAFLAGGIGITPFRSMLTYLLDRKEERDIVMLYSNRTPKDIAYESTISRAEVELGLKNIYTITDTEEPLHAWSGKVGFINEEMIKEEIPDYPERYFYISGTQNMVVAFDKMLKKLGVPKNHIKKDFFPGFV
ncbi:MAG TPA: RnfABCDGE type electron transport complex subunit D [Candidatus Paceibacterota bacterium]